MKYLFVICMAIVVFAVSCAKKDNKQKVGKPGATTAQDCSGKNAETQVCKDKLAKEAKDKAAQEAAEKIETDPSRKESGAAEAKPELETIPNLKDLQKMSITLSNQTALIADIKSNSDNNTTLTTKVICIDLKDIDKLEEVNVANPDNLPDTNPLKIFLFNKSSLVADVKVNVGDKTDPTKLYLLTCNSGSTVSANQYTNSNAPKTVEVRNLKKGQSLYEAVKTDAKAETGIVTSFECNDDDQILKDSVVTQGAKAANRIRLRKQSSVLVYRAVGQKVGDKKLSELGSDKQKEVKFSIITCEG